jgi:hypothetical protein
MKSPINKGCFICGPYPNNYTNIISHVCENKMAINELDKFQWECPKCKLGYNQCNDLSVHAPIIKQYYKLDLYTWINRNYMKAVRADIVKLKKYGKILGVEPFKPTTVQCESCGFICVESSPEYHDHNDNFHNDKQINSWSVVYDPERTKGI